MHAGSPSPWVAFYLQMAAHGATALDVATGAGRHARLALERGFAVTAIDRDLSRVTGLADRPGLRLIGADLEDGSPWPLGGETFNAVIVTNYLYRPLMASLVGAVAADGVFIYETFARGHERYGRPSNPNFLLEPGELLAAVADRLTPVAFETVTLDNPKRIVQRIAATGPDHFWRTVPPGAFRS